MAGLYIHIPFCKKACYYCDFHFVASLKNKTELLKALTNELITRKDEWKLHVFETIYFGGGTPTVLTPEEIRKLIAVIFDNYAVAEDIELTIEANPDDLSSNYIDELKKTPVNRLSIGIQSFQDNILQFLNRRHNGMQALESIKNAQKAGFKNITVDLMYGIPGLKSSDWEKTIETFLSLDIDHLSAYHLGIEPKTVFSVWQKRGLFKAIDENESLKQYELLISFMKSNSYTHYEISNFARNNRFSKHNTSYWTGIPYLGIGPSAHSYQLNKRRWNLKNNTRYIESVLNNRDDYFEWEELSLYERYNDYILTTLRTQWGADLNHINKEFGAEIYSHCLKTLESMKNNNRIVYSNNIICISEEGWLISDRLISEFFIV